jgi:hypothetical protein
LKRQETLPVESGFLIEMKPHIVVNGLEAGVTQPFGEERITIGRRVGNHLTLKPTISLASMSRSSAAKISTTWSILAAPTELI